MSLRLSTLQAAILKAVCHYRFLTHSQLLLLRLGRLGAIRKATWFLCRHPPKSPLLQSHQVAPHARLGQIEKVFSISGHGLDALSDCFPNFQKPVMRPASAFYDADFFHRRETISFRIRLEQALRHEPEFQISNFANYFERKALITSKSFFAATRLDLGEGQVCIPDSIFDVVHCKTQTRATFALEYIRGCKRQRTIRQMETHARVFQLQALAKQRQLPAGQNSLALFVFENPALARRMLHFARDRPHWLSPFRDHFHLTTQTETTKNILTGWTTLHSNTPVHLLLGPAKPIS